MSALAWIAVVIFGAAYVLIATEKINRVAVALGGAALMLALGATDAEHAFFSEESGIDWNVIFLLLGMMVIVAVLKRTGLFEYVAIWAAKKARGRPFPIMVILIVVTGVVSAALDNVTTGVAGGAGDAAGVRPARRTAGAVPDRRGSGLERRRHRDVGRGSAEHHHREPVGFELQRLPRCAGAVRAGRAGGVGV